MLNTQLRNFADYCKNENMGILGELLDNEYIYEYLVIEFHVFNAGIVYEDPIFTNDIEFDELPDQAMIFRIEEITENYKLIKEYINHE